MSEKKEKFIECGFGNISEAKKAMNDDSTFEHQTTASGSPASPATSQPILGTPHPQFNGA